LITEGKLQTELRRMNRLRELGDDPSCICGEKNPEALTRCKRSLLENHHIAGSANDSKMTIVLCLTCHRKATEKQRQCGVQLCHQPRNLLERLVEVLKGLASFFLLANEILLDWAEQLSILIVGLDAKHPEWRSMPEVE
jgi:hypothetical protein